MLALVIIQRCTLFVGVLDDILKEFPSEKETPNSKWISPINTRRKVDCSVEFRAKYLVVRSGLLCLFQGASLAVGSLLD
jgi:hypothetical protein